MHYISWVSPKATKKSGSKIHGNGLFALQDIVAGELIALKGGHLIDRETLEANKQVINHSEMQITDELWLAPLTADELEGSMISVNHSCEPNMVVQGQIANVAYKDIAKGEEITADYGVSFDNKDFKMECNCGSASCRAAITGLDWQKPELQEKYQGNFPWYIERKLNQ